MSKDLVTPKPWRDRANTLGYISGGSAAQVFVLRQVLSQLPRDSKSILKWTTPEGNAETAVCEKLCRTQLSTGAFVERTGADEWAPTEAAADWLKNDDASFLACHIHVNVKFFGEMLAAIGPDTKQTDMLEIAKTSYGMNWSTADQVHRRAAWLKSLGMIEIWGQKIVRTSNGDALLAQLALCSPDEATGSTPENSFDEPIADEDVLGFVSSMSDLEQENLRERRALISYIPRGRKSANYDVEDSALTPTAAVRTLVNLLSDGVTVEEFMDLCGQELGISKGSFNSTLHTLRNMGLIEQAAYNFYKPANNAIWLVEIGHEKALIAYLHARYAFFGEILQNLNEPLTSSQLVKLSKERYGYSQASNGEIRVRLGFLQDAGLVDRIDWQRFRVTSLGKKFASLLSLQRDATDTTQEVKGVDSASGRQRWHILTEIVRDLKKFSEDGNESKAFEATVGKAFRFMGFDTDHLGGSGQTDVVAHARLAPADRYRIIIDAKSSSNGVVAESAVNFNVLKDHKKKHSADHVVVVAPDFANRLKDWAVNNGVILLRADDLAAMLAQHAIRPVSLIDLRDTFTRVDTQKDDIFERYQSLERRSSLMRKIMELTFQEAVDEDPVAAGSITLENIIYALRKELSPRPSNDEIRETLDFLSSPFVAALEENKGRYKLADSPHNVSLRLYGLGEALKLEE